MKNQVYRVKNLSLIVWNGSILLCVPDGCDGVRILFDYKQATDLVRVLTILNAEIKPKDRRRCKVKSKTE